MIGRWNPFRVAADSPLIRELLDRAVAAGAEVAGHSESASEAIAALAPDQPDLIVLDIRLRSGTGFDVLKALQAAGHARSAIKIVFTNYATPEYRDLGLQLGANAFFDKASEGLSALNVIHRLAAQRPQITLPATASARAAVTGDWTE